MTSTTTACALFATAVSNITSLRCFGIYTGLVVLTDYVLMVTYLPSVVLMHEFFIKGGVGECSEAKRWRGGDPPPFPPLLTHLNSITRIIVGFAEKIKTLPCFKICVQPQVSERALLI